jgi:hypothetical protein
MPSRTVQQWRKTPRSEKRGGRTAGKKKKKEGGRGKERKGDVGGSLGDPIVPAFVAYIVAVDGYERTAAVYVVHALCDVDVCTPRNEWRV